MKKLLSLLLSLALVFSVLAPATFAADAEDTPQPFYVRIATFNIDFDIASDGKSTCYSKVTSAYLTDTVDVTMELQRVNNGDWETVKTWTGSGTRQVSLDKIWYVLSGYTYQLCITAEVYDANGNLKETETEYSTLIKY